MSALSTGIFGAGLTASGTFTEIISALCIHWKHYTRAAISMMPHYSIEAE
jgi:hypothetical protein